MVLKAVLEMINIYLTLTNLTAPPFPLFFANVKTRIFPVPYFEEYFSPV